MGPLKRRGSRPPVRLTFGAETMNEIPLLTPDELLHQHNFFLLPNPAFNWEIRIRDGQILRFPYLGKNGTPINNVFNSFNDGVAAMRMIASGEISIIKTSRLLEGRYQPPKKHAWDGLVVWIRKEMWMLGIRGGRMTIYTGGNSRYISENE
jgi:hypothetical protein